MSYENVKMSKIMDHNVNHHTDELYDPLRKVLKKSGMPMHFSRPNSSLTPDKVSSSKITHDYRMLSAIEADKIVLLALHSLKRPSFRLIDSWSLRTISKESMESISMHSILKRPSKIH
jgi:hypothetical protein